MAGQCTLLQLSNASGATEVLPLCPTDSQVGTVAVRYLGGPFVGAAMPVVPLGTWQSWRTRPCWSNGEQPPALVVSRTRLFGLAP